MATDRTHGKTTRRLRTRQQRVALSSLPLPKKPLAEDQAAVQELRKYSRPLRSHARLPSHIGTHVVPWLLDNPWNKLFTFKFPLPFVSSEQTLPQWLRRVTQVLKKQTAFGLIELGPTAWTFYLFLSLPRRQLVAKRFLWELRSAARADGVVTTRRQLTVGRGPGYYLRAIRHVWIPFHLSVPRAWFPPQ
jgi:hypothetical protein